MKKPTFDQVMKTATEVDYRRWTNHDIALFHYFNPNGIAAKRREQSRTISRLVGEGKLNSGWIVAHGSMNDYAMERLYNITKMERPRFIKLSTIIDMLQMDFDKAQERLKEMGHS